jgi:hypothetical protein
MGIADNIMGSLDAQAQASTDKGSLLDQLFAKVTDTGADIAKTWAAGTFLDSNQTYQNTGSGTVITGKAAPVVAAPTGISPLVWIGIGGAILIGVVVLRR